MNPVACKLQYIVFLAKSKVFGVLVLLTCQANLKTTYVFYTHSDSQRANLARISHSPPAAIAYLIPSSGLVLIADFDVFQYAFSLTHCDKPKDLSQSTRFRYEVCEKPGLASSGMARLTLDQTASLVVILHFVAHFSIESPLGKGYICGSVDVFIFAAKGEGSPTCPPFVGHRRGRSLSEPRRSGRSKSNRQPLNDERLGVLCGNHIYTVMFKMI